MKWNASSLFSQSSRPSRQLKPSQTFRYIIISRSSKINSISFSIHLLSWQKIACNQHHKAWVAFSAKFIYSPRTCSFFLLPLLPSECLLLFNVSYIQHDWYFFATTSLFSFLNVYYYSIKEIFSAGWWKN